MVDWLRIKYQILLVPSLMIMLVSLMVFTVVDFFYSLRRHYYMDFKKLKKRLDPKDPLDKELLDLIEKEELEADLVEV